MSGQKESSITQWFNQYFSLLFLSSFRFHTKEPEQSKRTCALCLGDLPEDSPHPKICLQCSERHNFRQLMGRLDEPMGDMKKCPLCDDSLATSAQLHEHLQLKHPSENSSKDIEEEHGFVCCFCSITFNTLAALQAHIPAHGEEAKLYGCRSCSRRFHFKDDLDNHVAETHLVVAKEEIKREREDSEEDNSEVEEEERIDDEAGGDDTEEIDAEGGDDEEPRGDNGAETPEDRDSIVNVESEIKIDNDSYATVCYC